eukprot:1355350-Pleurochrysis_carterae.AAC.1
MHRGSCGSLALAVAMRTEHGAKDGFCYNSSCAFAKIEVLNHVCMTIHCLVLTYVVKKQSYTCLRLGDRPGMVETVDKSLKKNSTNLAGAGNG